MSTKTEAVMVPWMPIVEMTEDMLFKIETGETVTWRELKQRLAARPATAAPVGVEDAQSQDEARRVLGWFSGLARKEGHHIQADWLDSYIASLRSPEPGGGWRTIESAPKDGTWIQAWRTPPGFMTGTWEPLVYVRWEDEKGAWVWPDETYQVFTEYGIERANLMVAELRNYADKTFSHWRPLPASPSEEG